MAHCLRILVVVWSVCALSWVACCTGVNVTVASVNLSYGLEAYCQNCSSDPSWGTLGSNTMSSSWRDVSDPSAGFVLAISDREGNGARFGDVNGRVTVFFADENGTFTEEAGRYAEGSPVSDPNWKDRYGTTVCVSPALVFSPASSFGTNGSLNVFDAMTPAGSFSQYFERPPSGMWGRSWEYAENCVVAGAGKDTVVVGNVGRGTLDFWEISSAGDHSSLVLADTWTQQERPVELGHAMAVSPDGLRVLASSKVHTGYATFWVFQKTGGSWDLELEVNISSVNGGTPGSFGLAMGNNTFASGQPATATASEGSVVVWEVIGGAWQETAAVNFTEVAYCGLSVAFLDNDWMAVGCAGFVLLHHRSLEWNVAQRLDPPASHDRGFRTFFEWGMNVNSVFGSGVLWVIGGNTSLPDPDAQSAELSAAIASSLIGSDWPVAGSVYSYALCLNGCGSCLGPNRCPPPPPPVDPPEQRQGNQKPSEAAVVASPAALSGYAIGILAVVLGVTTLVKRQRASRRDDPRFARVGFLRKLAYDHRVLGIMTTHATDPYVWWLRVVLLVNSTAVMLLSAVCVAVVHTRVTYHVDGTTTIIFEVLLSGVVGVLLSMVFFLGAVESVSRASEQSGKAAALAGGQFVLVGGTVGFMWWWFVAGGGGREYDGEGDDIFSLVLAGFLGAWLNSVFFVDAILTWFKHQWWLEDVIWAQAVNSVTPLPASNSLAGTGDALNQSTGSVPLAKSGSGGW